MTHELSVCMAGRPCPEKNHRRMLRMGWVVFGVLTGMVWQSTVLAADNCQLQISNRTIDYGQMTRAELVERKASPSTFSLGKQSMTLTATCRQPALITLFFRGAAADSASYRFGNGGSFTLQLSGAQLDGKAVNLGKVKVAGQQPEIMSAAMALLPNDGAVPVTNERPVKGSSFSMNVEIEALVSAAGSRVADQTVWRGNGSFELIEN